jgi:hypothetical protein
MRRPPLSPAALFAACAILALLGCRDSTGLKPPAGVYDLTTVLDTVSFETGAPSPPDCPSFTMYCTHYRAFAGGSLGGLISVSDQSGVVFNLSGLTTDGRVSGEFCTAFDLAAGCTAVGPKTEYTFPTGVFYIDRESAFAPDSVFISLAGPGGSPAHLYLRGVFVDGDIVGRIYWSLTTNRSPPAHLGSFVARRRD